MIMRGKNLRGDVTERSTLVIYESLKKRMIDGYYTPGKKFNQSEIAKEFGVSRTPVIKALSILEADGLVDNIPQKGYYVHEFSVRDLYELYSLKVALEFAIVEDVIQYSSKDDIQELREIFMPFSQETDINAVEYQKADMEFHSQLIRLSQNNLIIHMYETNQLGFRNYQSGLFRSPKETLPEHFAIINSIEQGDTEQAKVLVYEHTEITRKKIGKFMDNLLEMDINPAQFSKQGMKNKFLYVF